MNVSNDKENKNGETKHDSFNLLPLDEPNRSLCGSDNRPEPPLHTTHNNDRLEESEDSLENFYMIVSPDGSTGDSSSGLSKEEEDRPASNNRKDDDQGSEPNKQQQQQKDDSHSPSTSQESNSNKRRKHDEPEATRLEDIIGHDKVKMRIEEIILPLGLPPSVTDRVLTGIRSIPASILLHGPPGCGKTQLARAIAGEAHAAFFSVSPGDIFSKFVGESEASVRGIFQNAVVAALQLESKCAVVFFDEIDALGMSRDTFGSGEGEGCARKVLAELLVQLNVIADKKLYTLRDFGKKHGDCDDDFSFDSLSGVRIVVVAATNRVYDCDAALVRRFAIQLEVGYPSFLDRIAMFHKHLSGIEHCLIKEQFQYLSAITDEWSGSAIENLTRDAAMAPVRECIRHATLVRRQIKTDPEEDTLMDPDTVAHEALLQGFDTLRSVNMNDFFEAIELITGEFPATTRPELQTTKTDADHYESSNSLRDHEGSDVVRVRVPHSNNDDDDINNKQDSVA